jgi:hypothetical protein
MTGDGTRAILARAARPFKGWLLQTSKDTMYNPMSSLPLVLIAFNHGAYVRTMRYLTDVSDPIKEINAISSLSPPPHTCIAGSLDHDLQTETGGGGGGGRYQYRKGAYAQVGVVCGDLQRPRKVRAEGIATNPGLALQMCPQDAHAITALLTPCNHLTMHVLLVK